MFQTINMGSLTGIQKLATLRPHPTLVAPGGDLSQRTGKGRVMTETIPIKKQIGLPSGWFTQQHRQP
jgi:hypothetical protein